MRLVKACSTILGLVLASALGVLSLTGCDCGEQIGGSAELNVDKQALKYDNVAVGYPRDQVLKITNAGRAGLVFKTLAVKGGSSSPFSIMGVQDQSGNVNPQLPGSVGIQSYILLVVRYNPATETSKDSDELDILTNDKDPCPSDQNPCHIALSGTGAPPNAQLEVDCEDTGNCPNGNAMCRPILDVATNTHPERVSFNFCQVSMGTTLSLKADLRNIGNIPLTMNGFTFNPAVGDPTGFSILSPAVQQITIQPGQTQVLAVAFSPTTSSGAFNTGIDIQTNDNNLPSGQFKARLLAESVAPEIYVNPLNIPFTGVNQGSSDTKPITVGNKGTGTLVVSGVEVTGGTQPGEFTVDKTDGFTVDPGNPVIVNVTYSPRDSGTDLGSVKIHSNDANQETVEVTLGAEVRPDLDVTPPDVVQFINVPQGGSDKLPVTLRNIGHADLTISAIDFTLNPGDPKCFGFDGLPASFPGTPIMLSPAGSIGFNVTFTDNPLIQNEQGQFEITHDSPSESNPYIVLVISTGTPANLPPVAKVNPSSLVVNGLKSIPIDGSGSFDPDPAPDHVARYQWSFLFLPTDPISGKQSTSTLTSIDQAQTSFTPDITGKYIVRLVVFDTYGAQSLPADSEISVNP